MTDLVEYLQKEGEVLRKKYEKADEWEHNLTKGKVRETFVQEVIEKLYPNKYVIGDGELVDSAGRTSQQTDVVIYDEGIPVLDFISSKRFLAEGVFAHIEVKSEIDRGELKDSFEKANTMQDLERNFGGGMVFSRAPEHVPTFVFGFTGPENASTLKSNFHTLKDEFGTSPDAVCVLNLLTISDSEEQDQIFYSEGESAFPTFVLDLIYHVHLASVGVQGIDLGNYYPDD